MVVGESAGVHGFRRPNPVSLSREPCRLRLAREWLFHTQKNEDTWYSVLGHYDAENRRNPRRQRRRRRKPSRSAVIRTAYYTFVPNRAGNLNVPYLVENGGRAVLNWNWLDNDWDASNPALRFANLFVSPPERTLVGFSLSDMSEIDFSKIKTVHFVGIGGIGTSAIARMFLLEGLKDDIVVG